MERFQVEEKMLKSAGAELLPDGLASTAEILNRGTTPFSNQLTSSRKSSSSSISFIGNFGLRRWFRLMREEVLINLCRWQQKLNTYHLPEMVFGESGLTLKHLNTGVTIHFNAMVALAGWKQEALPPVEVPAAAKWKFRSKPLKQVILDYDYTITTPYYGSETMETTSETIWNMPVVTTQSNINLFNRELCQVVGFFFCASGFDGVLMRLRDTHMHCVFGDSMNPVVIRERCGIEATFKDLSAIGLPVSAVYK